jgi:hypothetical protein
VHLQDGAGITTVGVSGGRWAAAQGVATPDWSTIFTLEAGRLRTLDGVTGAERASRPVAAGLRPVVSSADGRFVALTDSPTHIGQGVLPPGRARSTVVVAPADPGAGEIHTLVLDGNVVPEGFSSDHAHLFVIEFLPPMHPERYRVRQVEIASGLIGPVFTFDKTLDTEEMQGLSRTQVFSAAGPSGAMLYTLYTRADGSSGYAEVHALALDGGLVHCTDLPPSLRIAEAGGAIAVSPDGLKLYVASAAGAVAEIDTSSWSPEPFPIVRTTHITPGPGTTRITLAADNRTVWVGLGGRVVGLDSTDLHPIATATLDQPIQAIAVAPVGTLYAATTSAVEVVQPAAGSAHAIATIDTAPTRLAVL